MLRCAPRLRRDALLIRGPGSTMKVWVPALRRTAEVARHRVRDTMPLLPRLRPTRLAVAHQPIEMHPYMGGFRGGVGERDGAIERHAGLLVTAELHQERTAHAEEMKIIRKPLTQWIDHLQRRFGPAHLGHRNGAVERHHR